MGHTITIRLTPELAVWLAQAAANAGVPQGRIVRQELERAMLEQPERPFLRLAGSIDGPEDLSSRRGFSRSSRKSRRTTRKRR
jgi:hypothetical protein